MSNQVPTDVFPHPLEGCIRIIKAHHPSKDVRNAKFDTEKFSIEMGGVKSEYTFTNFRDFVYTACTKAIHHERESKTMVGSFEDLKQQTVQLMHESLDTLMSEFPFDAEDCFTSITLVAQPGEIRAMGAYVPEDEVGDWEEEKEKEKEKDSGCCSCCSA